ncbi:MAG TPA: TonB-dependent receptor [Gemmatimonadales bacterium]|jgi:iron complex outermembrane receptor protein
MLLLALGALQVQDTARPRALPPVVVTAERASSGLATSAAAVTRLSAAELSRMPRATLADLLRRAPGFSVVDFDGLGFDPQLMVRGFYGGGEAEYVVVQVDGKPVNQLQSGVVAWDVLPPLAAIDAIEIVRGGASSLYGDAAIGGVINVITRSARAGQGGARVRWEGSGASYGSWRGGAHLAAEGSTLWVGADRTDGYRAHAGRTAARGGANVLFTEGANGRLGLAVRSHWRDYDEPGPLLESLLDQQRNGSDPLFRFDHVRDKDGTLSLDGRRRLGAHTELSATAAAELRSVDGIRTLALTPGFGETKERLATSHRATLGLQLTSSGTPIPGTDRLVLGIEASRGGLDSKYYRVVSGTRDNYAESEGERGDLDTEGSSTRSSGALYAQFTGHPVQPLRLFLGGRFDVLHDSFEPEIPPGQPRQATTHKAFSPKAGLNVQYQSGGGQAGNLYFSVSRSFKAPTLDQLYDQRTISIPFPPFQIGTSNPGLRPQHGTSLEAGLYQSARAMGARATVTLSAYQTDMKDEVDFDISAFRYVNIGRSRHRGLEAGGSYEGEHGSVFASYALQAATSRSGSNAGRRLKAIPRHALSAGASAQPFALLSAAVVVTHARGIFLDDANSVTLPASTRVDGQLSVHILGLSLLLEVRNLLDAKYNSSGFLDPAGSGEAYFYPAAGRVIGLGLRSWR